MRILLIDGNNLTLRPWFAQSQRGTVLPDPRNVAHTCATQLYGWIKATGARIDRSLVVFDATNGGGWRRELYPEYKGTRKAGTEEERASKSAALDAVRGQLVSMGITDCTVDGWEADDVLATLAKLVEGHTRKGIIVSSDRDLVQCLTTDISIVSPEQQPGQAEPTTPLRFEQARGFPARLMANYKALVGDTSDNIPPGGGVGEKSAPLLLGRYGPLEEVYARLGEVETDKGLGKRISNALRENEDTIRRNLRLTTLSRNVPGVRIPAPPIPSADVLTVGWHLVSSPRYVTGYKILSVNLHATPPAAMCEVVRTDARSASRIGDLITWPLLGLLTSIAYDTLVVVERLPGLAPDADAVTQRATTAPEKLGW